MARGRRPGGFRVGAAGGSEAVRGSVVRGAAGRCRRGVGPGLGGVGVVAGGGARGKGLAVGAEGRGRGTIRGRGPQGWAGAGRGFGRRWDGGGEGPPFK